MATQGGISDKDSLLDQTLSQAPENSPNPPVHFLVKSSFSENPAVGLTRTSPRSVSKQVLMAIPQVKSDHPHPFSVKILSG